MATHAYAMGSLSPFPRRQRGLALVMSLLLLMVMTVAGIAAMSGVTLQERMASNTRVQAMAFEAASAGVSAALPFSRDIANWGGNSTCQDDDRWVGPRSAPVEVGDAEFTLQVYCLADEDFADEAGFAAAGIEVPPQLFVLSTGSVRDPSDPDGPRLSQRQVEVRIGDTAQAVAGRTDSAIRIQGAAQVIMSPANSNQFLVDGSGGPAMSASTEANRDIMFNAVSGVDRLANYPGGIEHTVYGAPWSTPSELAAFVNAIRARVQLPSGGCGTVNYHSSSLSLSGNQTFNGVTYVRGNFNMSGNPSGSGILIVEGNINWVGTADFDGLVIGLGGRFTMGGGGGGRSRGSVFLTNLNPNAPDDVAGFGQTRLDVSGGGNHRVTYDCARLEQQHATLQCLGVAGSWVQDCDATGVAGPFGEGFVISSWRETLGWREEDFDPGG